MDNEERDMALPEKETANESRSERERRKMIARRIISVLVVLALIASVGANVFLLRKYYEKRDEYDLMNALYSEDYFYFDSLTVDAFKEKYDSGEEFVVFFSRPNCGNCARLSPEFISYCNELGISQKIYFVNVVILRRDNEAWVQFKETYGLEGTPTYVRYANGEKISGVGWTEDTGINFEMVRDWILEQGDYFGL